MPDHAPIQAAPDALGVRVEAHRFARGGEALFEDLRLDLPAGRWTCLLGPSGVGKSTLLRLIAGLEAAGGGVRVTGADGRPPTGRLAFMAQRDLLLPWLDALGNATLGARLRGEDRPAAVRRAEALLARVGLAEAAGRRPDELSGGMRQRVALVRTLMEDRPVVLMDEPFSALDAITRLRLQTLAAELLAGRTVLLVTHDPLEALRLGHRIHVLAGRPARLGPSLEPAGAPPRDPADGALLALQGRLLRQLTEAAP
jgi:putative hydroxymethylpyrimidine transport system ATP-binding protein